MRRRPLDRRTFLMGGLGALGGLGLRPSWAGPGAEDPRTLVLVQLSGGNDGLSTVIPHGEDAYHRVRSSIRHEQGGLLRLDDYRALHPELVRLRERYAQGGLAIVEGVGYPEPNRSHFSSLEIWHTADRRGRVSGEGWVGRLCETVYGDEADPNRVVHVGKSPPYSLYSTQHPAASFSAPYGYRWVKNGDELKALEERRERVNEERANEEKGKRRGESETLAFLRAKMKDAHASSAQIRAAAARYRTPVRYPADPFADELHTAAALIAGGLGTRVVSVELGGFDTHNDQRRRHDALMAQLDAALGAFFTDLERSEAGREAVVVVFSEFGRRVAENGSRGTDHGCAGPMFVAGGRVKGGLYGEHPSLTELDEGDLVFTTDFRSVYAEAIEACFDVPHEEVLGGTYPSLGLIRPA